MPTRLLSRPFWIAVEREAWRRARRFSVIQRHSWCVRGRIAHFRFRRHSRPCPGLLLANPVANDPLVGTALFWQLIKSPSLTYASPVADDVVSLV